MFTCTSSICMSSHLSVTAANPLKKRAVLPGVSCSFDESRTKLLDARIRFQLTSSGPHHLHTSRSTGLQSSTPAEQVAIMGTALVWARILGRASEYCHRHRYPPPSISPMACLHSRLSAPRRGRTLPRLSSSHTRYLLPVHADPLHPTSSSPKHPASSRHTVRVSRLRGHGFTARAISPAQSPTAVGAPSSYEFPTPNPGCTHLAQQGAALLKRRSLSQNLQISGYFY